MVYKVGKQGLNDKEKLNSPLFSKCNSTVLQYKPAKFVFPYYSTLVSQLLTPLLPSS